MVTFTSAEKKFPIETTIVSLVGEAGGIQGNVIRWFKQLNIEPPDDDELQQFINTQEVLKINSGLTVKILDFSQWQKNDSGGTSSMVASIIEAPHTQIFIKMTGNKESIQKNIDSYRKLIQSIQVSTP